MLHSKTFSYEINCIRKRALRNLYSDYKSLFNEFFDKNGFFTIHQANVYKYLCSLFSTILGEVFKVKETITYDLRMRNEFYTRIPKKVRYGTETVSFIFLFSKNLAFIPKIIKDSKSLPCLKKSIWKWEPNCSCRLCKTFS